MASTSKTKLLLSLAALSSDDGMAHLKAFSGLETAAGSALVEALKRKREKEQQEIAEAAATEIIDVLKRADHHVDEYRSAYKSLRRQLEAHKSKMENITIARMYGEETMNFLPLSLELGDISIQDLSRLSEEDKTKLAIPKADRDRLVKKLAEARKKAGAA